VNAAGVGNRLLAGLPSSDRVRLLQGCEPVRLCASDLLYQAGDRMRHVYFPTRAYVSIVTPLDACAGLEVALVGSEGMLGLSAVFGVGGSSLNHLVRGDGAALRIGTVQFRREIARSAPLRRRLDRYAYVRMHQLAQTAACTRFHQVEARLARWLLTTCDRAHADHFHATHESLAYMLGVRRVGVTLAASALQERGLIRYTRGQVRILDRDGLLARSCGCYLAANSLYERVLG
jgi:CRP-like cAMP-binding protein